MIWNSGESGEGIVGARCKSLTAFLLSFSRFITSKGEIMRQVYLPEVFNHWAGVAIQNLFKVIREKAMPVIRVGNVIFEGAK